jgi:hypothetical protein
MTFMVLMSEIGPQPNSGAALRQSESQDRVRHTVVLSLAEMQIIEYRNMKGPLRRKPQPGLAHGARRERADGSGQDRYCPQQLASHDCREDHEDDGGEHYQRQAVRPSPVIAFTPNDLQIGPHFEEGLSAPFLIPVNAGRQSGGGVTLSPSGNRTALGLACRRVYCFHMLRLIDS